MKSSYRDWPQIDSLPPGWRVDKTTGSPLAGYVFAINGRSVLHGQARALLRVHPEPTTPPVTEQHRRAAYKLTAIKNRTFEEAMTDPITWRLIEACATGIRNKEAAATRVKRSSRQPIP